MERVHANMFAVGCVMIAIAGWGCPSAKAQSPALSPSAAMNPFANTATNPFLNPYLAAAQQQPMDSGTAALYFLAARQASGGLGSGRLNGTRPSAGTGGAEAAAPSTNRIANAPGASASRYFNRPFTMNSGAMRYFGRQTRNHQQGR